MEEINCYCLVCASTLISPEGGGGGDGEVRVKIEPRDYFVDGGDDEDNPVDLGPAELSVLSSGDNPQTWSQEDNQAYLWFLKWFTGKGSSKKKTGFGKKGGFPFCGACKQDLGMLVRLQHQLEELQEKISSGVQGMRGKVIGAEAKFVGENGIYGKDARYKKIRGLILRKKKPSMETPKGPSKKGPVVVIGADDIRRVDELLKLELAQDEEPEPSGGTHEESGGDAEVHSGSGRPLRKSRKAGRKKKMTEIEASSYFDDFDYSPPNSPPSSPPPPSKRPVRSTSAKKKKLKDPEWTLDEDKQKDKDEDFVPRADSSSSEDEPGEPEDPKTGNRKHYWAKKDPTTGALTYIDLVFNLLSTDPNIYQCSKCGTQLEHKGSRIRAHYLKWHSNKFACHLCNFRGYGTFSLNEHITSAHGIGETRRRKPETECPVCGKPVLCSRLKRHQWSHKNEEEKRQAQELEDKCVPSEAKPHHQCDICGKTFGVLGNLRKHRLAKHAPPEVQDSQKQLCPECGGTFKELKSHIQRYHQVKDGRFVCHEDPNCGKVFKTANTLLKHKNAVHRKLRPWKCTQCPREFSNRLNLEKHVNLHLGIRPWKCNYCEVAFANKYSLARHEDIYHSGTGNTPRRKAYIRGPTLLAADKKKKDLQKDGKYLPPSALASWAAGRESESHGEVVNQAMMGMAGVEGGRGGGEMDMDFEYSN